MKLHSGHRYQKIQKHLLEIYSMDFEMKTFRRIEHFIEMENQNLIPAFNSKSNNK